MQPVFTDIIEFEKIIEKFQRFVSEKNPDGSVSFNTGWLDEQEGYKKKIPVGAYNALETAHWDKTWIGTGKIIGHIVKALRYDPGEGNNLVDWHQVSAFEELKNGDIKKIRRIESLIFRLYMEKNTDEEIFDELTGNDALGKTYDLISYLFYIKDGLLYLPNRPKNFERGFELLGDSFTFPMSGQCSWGNYSGFWARISKIRELLDRKYDEKIALIDAHSFCWVIAHHPEILKIDLNVPQVESSKLVLVDPPFVSSDDSLKPRGVRQFSPISKKERERLEQKNNQTGTAGELYVLNAEKQFLRESGKPALAEMVHHASKEDGDGLGYDIRSFLPNGQIKYIEVKTTTGKKNTKFIITDNELDFSSQNPDKYWLYRLYDFNPKAKQNPCYILNGNMKEALALYPNQFFALPKKKKIFTTSPQTPSQAPPASTARTAGPPPLHAYIQPHAR